MKKGFFLLFFLFFIKVGYSANLVSMKFNQVGETSEIILELDNANVQLKKNDNLEAGQLLIDLQDVVASERVKQGFDTSEFSGSVVFVSAYEKLNNKKDLRIAIQLRDNVRSLLKRDANKIIISVENRFGVFSQNKIDSNKTVEEKIKTGEIGKFRIAKSNSIEDILENLTYSGRKKYIGKKISFNVKDVPIADLLRMIANSSGFNIIQTNEIKRLPTMTMSLNNVPWDQALDTILGINKLVASKNGKILIVTTLRQATSEKKLEIEAKKLSEREEPLVTKIIPLSFATIKDILVILKEYLTKGRGNISSDERTNSLIVKDTSIVVEKIRKIVEVLDKQTPQVLIQAKIVEVAEGYSKTIGFTNGLTLGYDPVSSVTDASGPGFALSSASKGGLTGTTFMGLSIASFGRLKNLDFNLNLLETESKAKIISTPKVITQNKKAATIKTTATTSFAIVEGTGAEQKRTFEKIDATLSLDVTPQVTNDGSIAMEIKLNKESFQPPPDTGFPPDKASGNVSTNVLVDNGSTIVIGGVYEFSKSENHSGIPFLKDIPLIGWFFRTPYNPESKKSEMIIFITPRVINQEEAGLAEQS